MKSFLKIVLVAPLFTLVVMVVILCGVIFDLCSSEDSSGRRES